MQFIKNKITNQSKLLLTSSILILNGNMCGLVNSKSKPGQQPLKQSTTNSSPMIATQEHSVADDSSKREKAKQELSKYNLRLDETNNKGHESGYESGYESEMEPIYEEINYGKIDRYKDKKQEYNNSYINSIKEYDDQGYSSDSNTTHHTDGALKYDDQKSNNGNDTNGHIYAAIHPIMADESTNGKQSYDPQYNKIALNHTYSNDEYLEEHIYANPECLKGGYQSRMNSNTYDRFDASTREAIKPIQITKNLKISPDAVHEHIPKLKKYNLIEVIKELESIINEIVDIRNGNDHLLTEQQKHKFRSLKTIVKASDSPCNDAINFYNNDRWVDSPTKEDRKRYSKKIKKIAEAINKLLDDAKQIRDAIPVTNL